MKRLPVLLLVVAACGAGDTGQTTTVVPAATSSTVDATTTTAESPPPVECPTAPCELEFLPFGVGEATLDPAEIEPDVWTSVGGTSTSFWGGEDGAVAIALIRGTLPAVDWPGEKGEIDIDGTPGVVGPHADGTWVVGWFEQPGERCDLYSMVFYPPVAPSDVQQTLNGMNRVGG